MTRPEFWQQCYLAALGRAYNPARAGELANRAVLELDVVTGAGTPSCAVPVYRLRNGAEHFYTADPAERDRAVSDYGYVLEGVAFYAYPP